MSEIQQQGLCDHVAGCAQCQELLKALSEDAVLRHHAPQCWPPETPPPNDPTLNRLLEKLRVTPPPAAPARDDNAEAQDTALGFLRPPAHPGDLGVLGPYRVLAELGRGGMGVVLLAYDQELQRTVALKVLPPDRADERARARFVREARAAAGIAHDNVVAVYSVASSSDGPPYLVMQYVEGPTLRERIKAQGRLDPHEAARVAAQAAEGLAAAHRAGLVHRDIKPANIILDQVEGRAKIMDFGLARATALPGGITQAGTLLGTPEYMSPEQVQVPDRVDGRTDVYSLGVTLYEALTGDVPFRGVSHMVLRQIVSDDPRPPRRLSDTIPRDLETICVRCLQKEPGKRYASAGALAEDLRRFLAGEPIQARPVRVWERALKWARRRPAVAGLLASIILVTALGFAGILWQWREAVAARSDVANKAESLQINLYYKFIALAERELKRGIGSRADELLDQCPPEHRRWEWHYLKRFPFANSTLSHDTVVARVAFSPDGLHLASGELNGDVTVWDAQTGKKLHTFRNAQDYQVLALAFSPDGSRLATGGRQDRLVKVWDVFKGELLYTFPSDPNGTVGLVFSPDGKRLGAASLDHTVRLWDLTSCREILTFREHEWPLAADGLAFCADGQRLISVSVDGVVKVWDAATGKTVSTFHGDVAWVWCATFSSDGRWLVLGGEDGIVNVYQTEPWKKVRTLEAHASLVLYLALSPDGRRLASAGEDSTLKVWDVTTGHEALLLDIHSWKTTSLAFSPDGHRLASGSADKTVMVSDGTPWELPGLTRRHAGEAITWTAHHHKVVAVDFSPDSQRLVSAGWDRTVKVWDVPTGQELLSVPGLPDGLTGVAFSREGNRFAAASLDGTISICDAHSGEKICTLQAKAGPVYGVAFNPVSNALASAHYDGTVNVWNIERGRAGEANPPMFTITAHKHPVLAVAYSADGRLLVSAGGRDQENNLCIWEAATGHSIRKVSILPGLICCVAFSPDGRCLACSPRQWVSFVDVDTGRELFHTEESDGRICRVVFSPDGRRLVAASERQTVRVFDPVSGKEINRLRVSGGELWGVALSPDGRSLATCSGYKGKGTIQIWNRALWDKQSVASSP